jgi:bifunctional enzyme CysN/CysC
MGRPVRIVLAGHVDHGKSTLIGRLLHETGNLPKERLAEIESASRSRNGPLEWAYVTDALQEERDRAKPMTIDTTRTWLTWLGKRYEIIDAPGHREFVQNMITGASEADGALLVVDALEGAREQTRCHAHVLRLLGVNQLVLALNKLDALGYDRERFESLAAACKLELAAMGFAALATIPISAREGQNLVERSAAMSWYSGPALMEVLATIQPQARQVNDPLRLRVQDVYRTDTGAIAVGRVDSGVLALGDRVVVLPRGTDATVCSIERWPSSGESIAQAGESIGMRFEPAISVERGDVVAHSEDAPKLGRQFRSICFWIGETPPATGVHLSVQFGPVASDAIVSSVRNPLDTESLAAVGDGAIPRYAIVEVYLRTESPVPLDAHGELAATSRFVLMNGAELVACGFVDAIVVPEPSENLTPHAHLLSAEDRLRRNGHSGAVIWMTGLPAAGKSTLAMALERRLFDAGGNVFAIDGDRVRQGLNSDLAFSAEDRSENVRRVAEVAALFAEAGAIVIAALISPQERDRAVARRAAGRRFHEIFVDADLETCERRDPKGLYKRARAGEVADFTGVSAPYERPFAPELVVNTAHFEVEESLGRLIEYVWRVTGIKIEESLELS